MKIVEAISDMNIGGAGVVLLTRLVSSEEARNTTVLIPKGSELRERLSKEGIEFVEINGCYNRSFDLFAIPKYMSVLRKLSPDVVNCHGCFSCRVASFLCRIPIRIYTRHCVFPLKRHQKNFIYRFFFGVTQKILSNHVIAVADAARDNLIELGMNQKYISVIINGVQGIALKDENERRLIRERLNVPNDSIVISIFARLEKYKGHEDFINAAYILLKKSKKYRFLIVGNGSQMSNLKKMVDMLGINEYVIFTGFVDDVSDYFNITDINVNCSCGTETSSLALSEGMSLGIPCVVSEYGGNTHMVKNGKNGFTYPVHDYNSLAKRIILLSLSKTLYKKMSDNAYKRFSNEFNSQKMSRQTYSLYKQMFDRLK